MAGSLGGITNNLLGLQQLAQGRQEIERNNQLAENNRVASDSLRRYQASEQAGNPDYNALQEAFLRSPDLSSKMLQGAGITDKRKGLDAANYAIEAYGAIDDPERFVDLTQKRIQYLEQNGRDASHSKQVLQSYMNGDKEKVRGGTKTLLASLANQGYLDKDVYADLAGVGGSAASQEFASLTKGLSAEDAERARRVKLGLDPRAIGSADITTAMYGYTDPVAQSKGAIAGAVEGSKTAADINARIAGGGAAEATESQGAAKGKASTERRELFKTQGLAAAENIPTLRRAIDLQDEILSGGGANALRKMANYLGVASQDEGELNSLFGQNILGQLKSTFGGNPTEGERAALEQAQASFSQTGKINSKLLKNALKLAEAKVQRGKRAAQADKDDGTIAEIDAALKVSLGDESVIGGSGNGKTPGIAGETKVGRFTVKVNN